MTLTVLCAAQAAGVLPDPREAELRSRRNFGETVAITISSLLADANERPRIGAGDVPERLPALLDAWVSRNEAATAAAVVRQDGTVVASVGGRTDWATVDEDSGTLTDTSLVYIPLYDGRSPFGQVQFRFRPLSSSRWGISVPPLVRAFAFIAAAGFLTHLLFLRRMLRYLDPSRAVPARVRTTLDTLAEGLVLLDQHSNVVLANAAIAKLLGVSPQELQGRRIGDLKWLEDGRELDATELPWSVSIATDEAVVGQSLQLEVCDEGLTRLFDNDGGLPSPTESENRRVVTFLVNSTPIASDSDPDERGALVSFDDITILEQKKSQLADTLQAVRQSSEEIQRQNAELERLATHDVLTGCVNRRRLFDEFESHWSAAQRHKLPLSCILTDIDHFKSVNDEHGHSVGDEVLTRVAQALRDTARDSDLVARYGGEEFCVLLPHATLDAAQVAAERFRRAIAALELPGLSVTASFGVTSLSHGGADPQEMIDQADRCLYEAKHRGRNCVVTADEIDLSAPMPVEQVPREAPASLPVATSSRIPFHAVTALIQALAYRDQRTASHCRRVADLAVATAEGLLSLSDCYTLEIASLLHDLGKIGVPDQILLKSGPLTDEEWTIMRRHDRIGVEIVRASFACPALTKILSQARTPWQDGKSNTSIPARILAVADAFDSMTTDQPYRAGRSIAEAFAELRRCSEPEIGQFDPEIVERFILSARVRSNSPRISVEKETALSIGMQIEHLAAALDDQDLDRLGAMATRVRRVAEQHGVAPVAEKAEQLSQVVGDSNHDLLSVLQSAGDLLSLCRSTQQTCVEREDGSVAEASTPATVGASDRDVPAAGFAFETIPEVGETTIASESPTDADATATHDSQLVNG